MSELQIFSGEVKHVCNIHLRLKSHFCNVYCGAFIGKWLGCFFFLAQFDVLVWPGNI